jgi:hypothetical protein
MCDSVRLLYLLTYLLGSHIPASAAAAPETLSPIADYVHLLTYRS